MSHTIAGVPKIRKSGGLEANWRRDTGYEKTIQAEVGERLEAHVFFRNRSVDPGFYAIEGYVGERRLGQIFFDYNGFSWFGRVEIRLNNEVYWGTYVTDEDGGWRTEPVKVRFTISGPLPLLRRAAFAELLVWLTCSRCVA